MKKVLASSHYKGNGFKYEPRGTKHALYLALAVSDAIVSMGRPHFSHSLQ